MADAMASWMEETDIDGFNLIYSVSPQDVDDFVDLVVPELQRRGVYRTEYPKGTLREKLIPTNTNRIADTHPAATYRRG